MPERRRLADVLADVDDTPIPAEHEPSHRLVVLLHELADHVHEPVSWSAFLTTVVKSAVEAGVLEQVGYGGCSSIVKDCESDEHNEWVLRTASPDELRRDHPIWPVYRVSLPTEETDRG